MTTPNPRSKLLPARGTLADLQFAVDDILEGEMMYAYDEDQYYQKEGGTFVAVGATKAQGSKADSALQDAPADGTQYVRQNGIWAVLDAGSGGVTTSIEGAVPYYAADGDVITGSNTADLNWDPLTGTLFTQNLLVNNWNVGGQFSVDSLEITGTGPATIESGSDISLNPLGVVDVNASRVVNVSDPTLDTDAANRRWVESAITTATTTDPIQTYTFSNNGSGSWNIQGQGYEDGAVASNPPLYLYRGQTYKLTNNADNTATFPLLIKSVPNNTGTGNQFTEGISQSDPQGDYIWTIPMDISITELYYQAQGNSVMSGPIFIVPANPSEL